jgi:hypothetical protein
MTKNLLFIATLGLIPAYIYPSGGFQIVDVPLAFIILYVRFYEHNVKYYKPIEYYIPFALWATMISFSYFLIYKKSSFIIAVLPILYAPLILFTFINIFTSMLERKEIYYIYLGLFSSILVTLFIKGAPDEYNRAILSFNDPNQLGYFAVILLGYIILLHKYKTLYKLNNRLFIISDIVLLVFVHYFMILSMSRTAMVIVFLMDIYLLIQFKNEIGLSPTVSLAIIFLVLFFIKPDYIKSRFHTRPAEDFTRKEIVKDTKFRIFHPLDQLEGIQFLIGKGQGQGMESHNFLIEIFRGYGFVGAVLFLYWLFNAISMSRGLNDSLFVWASLFLFNMGIYGLRWRGLWILLGLLFALVLVARQKSSTPRDRYPELSPSPGAHFSLSGHRSQHRTS